MSCLQWALATLQCSGIAFDAVSGKNNTCGVGGCVSVQKQSTCTIGGGAAVVVTPCIQQCWQPLPYHITIVFVAVFPSAEKTIDGWYWLHCLCGVLMKDDKFCRTFG